MLAPSVSTMTTLSLPFSDSGRPSVKGAPLETVRQPQAVPSGTLVLPLAAIGSIAVLIVGEPLGGHVGQRGDRHRSCSCSSGRRPLVRPGH